MRVSLPLPGRSSVGLRAIAIVAVVFCCARSVHAQQAGSGVVVDLGTADGPPGSTIFVPVNVAVPDKVSITRLELEVRFEKGLLSFVRADPTPQSKADGVTLATSTEDDSDDPKLSIVRLTATADGGLATSAVADLFFRITADASPSGGTSHKAGAITTVLKKTARVRTGSDELTVAEGRDGEVDITEGVALFGCFFYMH
jgi:hypothetical protein